MSPLRRRCKVFGVMLAALLILALAGCGKKEGAAKGLQPYTETRTLMNTVVSITVYAENLDRAQVATSAAYDHMSKLEQVLSNYVPQSDVSRVNRAAGLSVRVTVPTFFVVSRSLEVSKLTSGAFDITVGPLVSLWHEAGRLGRLPTDNELSQARALVGFDKVSLNGEDKSVKLPPGGAIDLGGIAKGYIVDQAIGVLRGYVSSALVNAGGDLYALGSKPGGEPWVIGVQDPRRPDDPSAFIETLYVKERAVATSGNYVRFVEIGGKRYSHIINPKTGWPVDAVPSATVVARDTTTADALATAVSVLPPEESVKLPALLHNVDVLLFVRSGDRWLRYESGGIEALTKPPVEK